MGCADKISLEWEKVWVYEILGYDDYLANFAVPRPKLASRAAIKEFHINFNPDKKQGFKLLAEKIKEQMMAESTKETRKCEKCKNEYMSDNLWRYVICKDCARDEVHTIKEFMFEGADQYAEYGDEFLDIMPTPYVNVERFLIEKVKADRDNQSNQLNPNNEAYNLSRGNDISN
jgi:hypothetical protein